MEAREFEPLKDSGAHLVCDLAETRQVRALAVDILLVNLVGKEDDVVLGAQAHDSAHALDFADLSCRAVGVGDDVDAHLHALCRRLGVRALEFGLTCATSLPPHRGST